MPTDLDAPNPTPHQPPVLPGDQVTCIQAGAPGAPIPGAIYTVAAVHEDDRNQWSVRLHPRTLGDAPSGLWPAINFIRNEPPTVHNAPGFTNGLMDDERDLPTVAATLAQQERDDARRDVGRGFSSPHMPPPAAESTYRPDHAPGTMRPITLEELARWRAPWEHPAPVVHDGAQAPPSNPITLRQIVSDAVREQLANHAAPVLHEEDSGTCANCRYGHPAGALSTWRRCHGGVPHPNGNEYAVWPLVHATDSCGGWKLKTSNPPTPSP